MKILPAIDLRDGQVVRLLQGRADAQTTYDTTPVDAARRWQDEGAQELHVVDLDGAFIGHPRNLKAVKKICKALDIPVELGGGLRTEEHLAEALDCGIKRAVLGTKACEDLSFVTRMTKRFGGKRIAVGIDARDGIVATKGWTEPSEWKAVDFAKAVVATGARTIIYTDIATDGMGTGPNLPALREVMAAVGKEVRVIASGGVATVEHVKALRELGGLYGVIVGKALYDEKLSLADIL